MTITQILNYVNASLKSSFSGAVEAIKKHTFNVKFPDIQKVSVNFPENQKISGKVDVKFPDVQRIGGKVEVINLPAMGGIIEKLEDIKDGLKSMGVEVKNFPEFPKKIEITNLPKEKEVNFAGLENKLDMLLASIKKLPTKFPDFPKPPVYPEQKEVKFPKSFSVDNLEGLKSENPKEYVPVRLTDGEEFYKAIEEFYQQVSSAVTFTDSQNKKTSALVDEDRHVQVDVLTAPPVTIDTSELATAAKQSDGSQVTKVLETIPTDVTKNNSSTLLSFNAGGELVYADETIGTKTYRTTFTRTDMVIDSTLPISAVVEL